MPGYRRGDSAAYLSPFSFHFLMLFLPSFLELEDDFVFLDQAEFFSGNLFDVCLVLGQTVDFLLQRFVFFLQLLIAGIDDFQFVSEVIKFYHPVRPENYPSAPQKKDEQAEQQDFFSFMVGGKLFLHIWLKMAFSLNLPGSLPGILSVNSG
jgi:hypothetical protein